MPLARGGQKDGLGLVGIAVLLFAATGFAGSLQDALDKIWDAPPRPGGIWSFITRALRRDAPGAVVRRGS